MYTQYGQHIPYALPPGQEHQDLEQGFEHHYKQEDYQQAYQLPPGADSDFYGMGIYSEETNKPSFPPASYPSHEFPSSVYPPSLSYEGISAANTAAMDSMTLGGGSSSTSGSAMLQLRQINTAGSSSRRGQSTPRRVLTAGEGSSGGGTSSGGGRRRPGVDLAGPISPPVVAISDDDEEDDAAARPPAQTASRVRQTRKEAIAAALGIPLSASLALSGEQEKLRLRKWLAEEWARQGLSVSMEAQDLARRVARLKILYPGITMAVAKMSHTLVKKGKGNDAWYLYDYHKWSDTYQLRIQNLETSYILQGVTDEQQIQHLLLNNFYLAAPKHYAKLADPQAEAAEVAIAQEVWNAFCATKLRQRISSGEPLSPELIAEKSWDWAVKGYYSNPVTLKYLYKFLRCFSNWSPDDLEHLKTLQENNRILAGLHESTRTPRRRSRRRRGMQ